LSLEGKPTEANLPYTSQQSARIVQPFQHSVAQNPQNSTLRHSLVDIHIVVMSHLDFRISTSKTSLSIIEMTQILCRYTYVSFVLLETYRASIAACCDS